MGKDYWNWSSRSSKRSSNNAATTPPPSGCMCAFFHLFQAHHPFHHFPSTTTTTVNQQQKSSPQDNNNNVPLPQAPRNSLEEESHTTTSSLIKQEQHFKIPRKIQVMKTTSSSEVVGDMSPAKTPTLVARLMGLDLLPPPSSPSCSSSSCLSTPNLHHHHHQNILLSKHRNSTDCVIVDSSPRRTASDLDYYHHRLSLQINTKEQQDLEEMRFSSSKRNHFDYSNNNISNGRTTTTTTTSSSSSSSPSHMARQIVKQVKKNVMMNNNNNSNRKVGQDITNTLKPREQLVTQIKLKKKLSSNPSSLDHPDSNSSSSSSFSPRLRLIETKNTNHNPTPPPPQPVEELPRVLIRPKEEEKGLLKQNQKSSSSSSVTKCNKKVNHEKFNSASSSKLKKQEEPFIIHATRTHNKKTHPLSNNLLNNINTVVPNLFPIKTEASPPPTKINHNKKQSSGVCDKSSPQQSSSPWSHHHSHRYKQRGMIATREFSTNDIVQAKTINHHSYSYSSSTTGEEFAAESEKHHHGPEFQYITGILSRTLNKEEQQLATTTIATTGQRFFHDLEEHPILNSRVSTPQSVKDCIFSMTQKLDLRWNRRLMSDLVDEVLMEVLRPTTKSDQKSRLWFLHGRCCCCCYQGTTVEGLMERVWKRIRKFPCKRCEFLEDIDGLIESEDMEKVKVDVEDGLEEEGENLVAEIEGNIWNTLVHESLMVMITI